MAEVCPERQDKSISCFGGLCANSIDFGVPVLHGLNFSLHGVALLFYRQGTSAVFSQHACLARLAGMLRMGGSVTRRLLS